MRSEEVSLATSQLATLGSEEPPPVPILSGFGNGVFWSYVTLLSTGTATFFTAGWAVRRVGEAGYGVFALAMALTALLTVLDYTIGLSVLHAGARARSTQDPGERARQRTVVHTAHGALALTGLATSLVAAAIGAALGVVGLEPVPFTAAAVALLGLAASLTLATSALPSLLLAYQRFSLRALATLAGVAVRIVVVIVAIEALGLAALGLALLLGVCTERLAMVILVRRSISWFALTPRIPRSAELRQVTNFAAPMFVISMSGHMFTLSDLAVVATLVGASSVGVYQAGSLLPIYALAVFVTGYNVVLPALIGSDDPRQQEDATGFLTMIFSYLAGAAFGLAAAIREDIVDLILGHRSSLAENVLLAFCAIGLANVLVHGSAWLLIARGQHGLLARAVAVELPLNLLLTIPMVWKFDAVGAAISTLLTVATMNFCVLPLITRDRFERPVLEVITRRGLVPASLAVVVAAGTAVLASPIEGSAPRVIVAAAAGAVASSVVGLALLGEAGRRTLRQALARSAPAADAGAVEMVASG